MKKLIVLLQLLFLSMGCAMTDRHHLSTTNWVDRTIVPDNKAAQWALTPVWIPVCLVTFTIDNVFICPFVSLPSAYDDTGSFLDTYDEVSKLSEDGIYSEWGFFPAKVVLSPLVFLGDWVGRGFFAIKPRGDSLWGWPQWGRQWERDEEGKLIPPIGSSVKSYDPSRLKLELASEGGGE